MGGLPRRVTATVVILTTREIWKEYSDIIFHNRSTTSSDLFAKIKDKCRAWTVAGAKCFEKFTLCD